MGEVSTAGTAVCSDDLTIDGPTLELPAQLTDTSILLVSATAEPLANDSLVSVRSAVARQDIWCFREARLFVSCNDRSVRLEDADVRVRVTVAVTVTVTVHVIQA
jgi:hypothetical protein